MERGLLSDQKLAEFYDEVVWMYLYQDFSDSPADKKAQRVAIRFGISSWPQHFLVDPYSLEVIGNTGRSLASFKNAVQRAEVGDPGVLTNKKLRDADARTAEFEENPTTEAALAALNEEDTVLLLRGLQHLNKFQPETLASDAAEMLTIPNDPIRFQVCEVLSQIGTAEHEQPLVSLVRNPTGSKNPNVLRMRAVQALAHCGEKAAIEAIRPFAVSGDWFNGLTGTSVDALATIGSRSAANHDTVRSALSAAYPVPPIAGDSRKDKACRSLALRVHQALTKLTGKTTVPFPETYDEAARAELVKAW